MAAALLAALSVSERIKTYGAYAGFAAVLGLAVLALLYFAQAREVKRLREWAGRAPERAAELEQRVQADASRRAALAARPVAAQTPAAQAVRPAQPGVAATPAAQQGAAAPAPSPGQPSPAPAGAAAAAGAAGPPAAGSPAATPAAPVSAGAQAAGTPAAPAAPGDKAATAARPGGAAAPTAPTGAPAVPAAKPAPAVPLTTGAPASATRPAGDGAGAGALGTVPPAPRAPGQQPPGARTASTTGGIGAPPARSRRSEAPGRSPVWGLVIAGVAVLVVLVLLITVVFGGGSDNKPTKTHSASPPVIPTKTTGTPAQSDFKVTVLNGTTIPNLARSVSDKVSQKGYEVIKVDNAPEQGRAATVVMFTPGHREDAFTVAKLINVGRDAVQPLDQNTAVVANGAAVVVTVGADQNPQ
jgi:LytR cell envelope-related transcriptional attenuator